MNRKLMYQPLFEKKNTLEQYKNVKSNQFNASLLNLFQKTILLTPNLLQQSWMHNYSPTFPLFPKFSIDDYI